MKHVISTTTAPGAVGPYSQAIEANGFVFVSGQLPLDPATGAFVPGGTSEQAEQSIKNLLAVLEAAGCKAEDVVKTTVFMIDIGDFGVVNEVYGKYFTGECPARCAMQAAALPKGAWLLELASAPYGFDRDAAAAMGLNVEVLPALPARYAPRSAARALKQVSMELLRETSL
mgnify:FL=1